MVQTEEISNLVAIHRAYCTGIVIAMDIKPLFQL